MKNENGFTLIEMIVSIAVIGALAVVLGVSSTNLMSNSKETRYRDTMDNLFDNASIYVGLSTAECKPTSTKSCTVLLGQLVTRGLIDGAQVEATNPMKVEGKTFTASDEIKVEITAEGKKVMSYSCTSSSGEVKKISTENINDFEDWGKCS